VSTVALLITVACAAGALALAFRGTYWLGGRNALRELAAEQIAEEVAAILDEADDDDDGGGVKVAA
jgi:hypothetical protein